MKHLLFLSALFTIVAFSSCGNSDDDNGSELAEITFLAKGSFGEDPLVMFERNYAYEDDMAIQMQLFQTYLSDIALIYEEDGVEKEEPLMDVALVSFGDVYTDAESEAGIEILKAEVTPRRYTGLKVGLGLTPELNATIPPDYELTHPLSQNYWEDASSYIFFKIEGNADLDADGQFQDKLTYHVGGGNNFSNVQYVADINLVEGSSRSLILNMDLQKILIRDNGTYWDLREAQFAHSTTSPAAVFMAQNFPAATQLELR